MAVSMKLRTRGPRRIAALCIALALALAACSSPTSGDDDSKKTGGAPDIADVYAAVNGLDSSARRAKLTELAKKDGGSITLYASINPTDLAQFTEEFTKATGI